MRGIQTLGAVAAMMLAAAGCNSSSSSPSGDTTNGCAATDFLDQSDAGTSTHLVGFGGTNGSGSFAFSPQCLTVGVGQSVTFQGDFTAHPLTPGVAPGVAGTASANNPIPLQEEAAASVVVTFPDAGTYPYYCGNHYGIGMYGAVQVK